MSYIKLLWWWFTSNQSKLIFNKSATGRIWQTLFHSKIIWIKTDINGHLRNRYDKPFEQKQSIFFKTWPASVIKVCRFGRLGWLGQAAQFLVNLFQSGAITFRTGKIYDSSLSFLPSWPFFHLRYEYKVDGRYMLRKLIFWAGQIVVLWCYFQSLIQEKITPKGFFKPAFCT